MSIFSTYTDSELLGEIKLDNNGAFTELYDRYWQKLYDSAYKRLKDEAASKDILQNVFQDIWLRRAGLEINNIPGYFHTAVKFQVFKFVAKSRHAAHFVQPFENITNPSIAADSLINEKDLIALVRAWLETLPRKKRRIFMMRYEEQLSTKEIANELKISQKTVQNQLGSSLQNLRSRLAHLFSFFL